MASSSLSDPRPLVSTSSDKMHLPLENAWSRIICRDGGEAISKEPSEPFKEPQTARQQQQQQRFAATAMSNGTEPEKQQMRAPMPQNAEPVIVSFDISNLNASVLGIKADVAGARVSEDISTESIEAGVSEAVASDASDARVSKAAAADGTEARVSKTPAADGAEARFSKSTWKKPLANAEDKKEPQPVMGAVTWPALAEARNFKASETRKSKKSGLKPLPPSPANDGSSLQESLSETPLHSEDGSNGSHSQPGGKHKSSFKGGLTGSGELAFPLMENISSCPQRGPVPGADVVGSDESMKHNMHMRTKGGSPATPFVVDHERVSHHRNSGMGLFPNNIRKWRNNNRDQSRGNIGWHNHGRGYENAGEMAMLLHEQRIGPRNMPRPHSHPPFVNINPGFYHAPNFQNGGKYYLPAGAPDFVHGAPYLPPLGGPPGGMMHGPDPISLRSRLLKQIDYYFSIGNLCKDVFLRSNMDDRGFVPVSLIASFNRVRLLSSNPSLILEALQSSSIVEVQHNRIRRRNDWEKWILRPNQTNAVNTVQENMEIVNLTEVGYRKLERTNDQCGDNMYMGSVPSLDGDGRHHCCDSSCALQENETEGATFFIPLTGDESDSVRSDRISSGACCISSVHSVEEKCGQLCNDDLDVSRVQHEVSLNMGASSEPCFSEAGVGRDNGDESNKSVGGLGPTSSSLQPGNKCNSRGNTSCDQKSCFSASGASLFEISCVPLELIVEENAGNRTKMKDLSHWTKHNPYFLHKDFEPHSSLHSDSGYLLKSHKEKEEDHMEVNDRDVQRLISSTHAQLGLFIAVP